MKIAPRMLAAACVLAGTTAAEAAEVTLPIVGIGLRAEVPSNSSGVGAPGSWICVPVNLGSFRLEPEFGAAFTESDLQSRRVDSTTYGAGLGAFYRPGHNEKSSVYLGGRFGFSRSVETSTPGSTTTTGRSLAAVAGVEFFPAPFVSIGAEAQARYGVNTNGPPGDFARAAELVGALAVRFYVPREQP